MRLKEWIEAYSGTVADAAELIGVTRTALHKIMNGERHPRPATVDRIVQVTCRQVTAEDIATTHREWRARAEAATGAAAVA
jgi:transcriptional regulator with XRE-family HTH domain